MNTAPYHVPSNITSPMGRILDCTTKNIQNANNTWEGWVTVFANAGVDIIDDDSGFSPFQVLNFREAVNGLTRCTVNTFRQWEQTAEWKCNHPGTFRGEVCLHCHTLTQ